MLALGRAKVAAIPSSYPPPRNHRALSLALPQPAQHPPFHSGLLHSLSALPRHRPLTANPQRSLHTPIPQSPKPEEGHHLCPLPPLPRHHRSFPLTGILGSKRPGGWCRGARWAAAVALGRRWPP